MERETHRCQVLLEKFSIIRSSDNKLLHQIDEGSHILPGVLFRFVRLAVEFVRQGGKQRPHSFP